MLRQLFRAAYVAAHTRGVTRTVAGVRLTLPASIARGVSERIVSPILPAFLEAASHAVVYDVGANVGVWTALALARGARAVVAIEPSAACVPILDEIRELYSAPVIIVLAAAGERDGLAHLAVNGKTAATNRLADRGAPVITRRVDAIAHATGLEPELVKIDAEGAEAAILRGMSGLRRWPLTVAELHWDGETPAEMLALGLTYTTPDRVPLLSEDALIRVNAVRVHRDHPGHPTTAM